ncbi:protein ALP1-like [Miscanthus floridulus]|uniref:protein ALP1-like n=1 Tax=Miscanthus floridulus TaxID=154761 RepID=UPI00345807C7
MFLHIVGHNERFRVVDLTFRRSVEIISRFFQKDCIGVIDGTHVLARVPVKMQAAFRDRKHTITQNILATVDFDLRFTYVLTGWEASTHDALILSDALERADGLRVPPGKFYLVDAGYAVRPGFLPPFRATRYHLREFGSNQPQNQRELFNLRHSSLRVTVERAFGALKNRFRILDNKPFHPYKTQEMDNMPDQVVNIGGEDNVVEQGGDHPADAKFLNTLIENYVQMEAIFGGN